MENLAFYGKCGPTVRSTILDNKPPIRPLDKLSSQELSKEFWSLRETNSVEINDISITAQPNQKRLECTPHKSVSIGKLVGFVESVPVIGSGIAAISLAGHALGMAIDRRAVNNHKKKINSKMTDESSAAIVQKIFNAKLSYALNARRARASALSLIPFLKPVVRLAQLARAKHNDKYDKI